MKQLFFIPLLLFYFSAFATKEVVVEKSSITTAPGIGGTAQIAYAFAKGDVVKIEAKASKQLERMLVYLYPEQVLGREKFTRKINFSFKMPEEGIVIFRFISDRGGTNDINYVVKRQPASNAVQNYNTRIKWLAPKDRLGEPMPVREGE